MFRIHQHGVSINRSYTGFGQASHRKWSFWGNLRWKKRCFKIGGQEKSEKKTCRLFQMEPFLCGTVLKVTKNWESVKPAYQLKWSYKMFFFHWATKRFLTISGIYPTNITCEPTQTVKNWQKKTLHQPKYCRIFAPENGERKESLKNVRLWSKNITQMCL